MTNHTNLPPVTDDDVAAVRARWHGVLKSALDAYRARLIAHLDATVPEPAPLVVLPTVDEIAQAIVADCLKGDPVTGEGWHVTAARAVLDLLESRVPHWVRIEPGTDVKAGTHLLLFKPSGEYACVIAAQDSELSPDPNGGTWYVDPRTIPAEPEDPALAVIIEWMDTPPLGNDAADASDLLTRIDAARADA